MSLPASSPSDLLKAIIAKNSPPSLLLILAEDLVRKDRTLSLIQDKFFARASNLAKKRWHGSSLSLKEIVKLQDEILSPSLFEPNRLILLEEIQDLKAEETRALLEVLQEFHKAPSPGVSIFVRGTSLHSNSVLLKFFQKINASIALEELKGPDLMKWAAKEFKHHGIHHASEEVVTHLSDIGEHDPDKIAALIEHLALYIEGDTATKEDLFAVFQEKLSMDEFALLDSITQGKKGEAEVLLGSLLRGGKNPFLLLSLLSRNFSTYLSIASLLSRGRQVQEIGQIMGVPPWLLKKHLAALRRYRVGTLKQALESILRADSKLKNRSAGPEAIFSELIGTLAH